MEEIERHVQGDDPELAERLRALVEVVASLRVAAARVEEQLLGAGPAPSARSRV